MRWLRRASEMAIAAGCVLGLTVTAGAAIPPVQPTMNVSAYAPPHRHLTNDPLLQVGEPTLIVVTGFTGGTTVSVRLDRSRLARQLYADRRGALRLTYTAGRSLPAGRHLMTFEGLPPRDGRPAPRDPGKYRALVTVIGR